MIYLIQFANDKIYLGLKSKSKLDADYSAKKFL